MTAAPLPMGRRGRPDDRMSTQVSARRGRYDSRIARRRWTVAIVKRLLPVVALALLSLIALWPELTGDNDRARLAFRRDGMVPQSGEMLDPVYHGVDERNRPYTMTATAARQVSPERINMVDPKGDVTLESGNWLMVQAKKGVYLQHAGDLDLSDDVHLYRDDGTTMTTDSASVDLKAGAAAGAEMVHAEGPFGTLDAQGFAMTDKGTVVQFSGPGRLVLTMAQSGHRPDAAPDPTHGGTVPPTPPDIATRPATARQAADTLTHAAPALGAAP